MARTEAGYRHRISRLDNGCDLHPHCLKCPEETCHLDVEVGRNVASLKARQKKAQERAEQTRHLFYKEGMNKSQIAHQLGVSKMTIGQDLRPTQK